MIMYDIFTFPSIRGVHPTREPDPTRIIRIWKWCVFGETQRLRKGY